MKRHILYALALSTALWGCTMKRTPLEWMVFKGTLASEQIKSELLDFGMLENSASLLYARLDIENQGSTAILFDPMLCFLVLKDGTHVRAYKAPLSPLAPEPPVNVYKLVTRPFIPAQGDKIEAILKEAMKEGGAKLHPRLNIDPKKFVSVDLLWPHEFKFVRDLAGVKIFFFRHGRPIEFFHKHHDKMPKVGKDE